MLWRVPAKAGVLPPTEWETARMDASKVLVAIDIWRCTGERPPVTWRWLRSQPPPVAPDPLELLRVDTVVPAATRRERAERALRGALRKVAEELQLQPPAAQHIRQFSVQEDGQLAAVIGVPRTAARAWLRGSGCGATFLRPLWSDKTAE